MDNSSPKIYTEFLPISRADMEARGWDQLDFVVVGGDAYVDHPSFGTAIISRLLEAEGYKVGVLAQPRYTDCEDFKRFGKPKYGFFIGGGNVDSMVSHYSVAKIPRAEDEYSPGGKAGARPDRSATVYTKLAKEAYRTCRSSWAGWKPPCGALPTTITGWTPCCPASPRVPVRTSSALAWANTRLWRRPPSGRRRTGGADHRCGRHLLPDRLRPPAGAVCGVCRLQKGGQR